MSTTDYPDTYKPATHGSFEGKIAELRQVTVPDMNTGEPVQKVVAEIEVTSGEKLTEGERVSVFLEGALLSKFQKEAGLRQQQGKQGFEPDEGVKIEYLGKKKSSSSNFSYHNYNVTFEHAAPDTGAFGLLASGAGTAPASTGHPESFQPAPAEPTSPTDDDIPF